MPSYCRDVYDRSPEAFGALVTRHAAWVHLLPRRTVRDPHLADNARQCGMIGRLNGDAFSLDRVIVADSVGVYHASNGTYFGFSANTARGINWL